MKRKRTTPGQDSTGLHVWLVFMKAFQALIPHAAESIERTELGAFDFGVFEAPLNKGRFPAIRSGRKSWLTRGPFSGAVVGLLRKGLVCGKANLAIGGLGKLE